MSPRLTYKNIAILGLVQIGVVVFGVLTVGLVVRAGTDFGMQMPWSTKIADCYGPIALVLPLLWIVAAMVVQHRNETDDNPEAVSFVSGVVLLLVLLVALVFAVIEPFLRITWSLSS